VKKLFWIGLMVLCGYSLWYQMGTLEEQHKLFEINKARAESCVARALLPDDHRTFALVVACTEGNRLLSADTCQHCW